MNLTDSINSSLSDYLIIEEMYCYSTNRFTTEIHKNSAGKTGTDPEFQYLFKEARKSKPVQKLNYQKWELSEHTRKCRAKHNYKETQKRELESTYRILTMIDRRTGKITVSLQYAPRKAACHAIYVGGGKC